MSFVRHPTRQVTPRYDTDDQDTAFMLQLVVSDRVLVLHGVQEVVEGGGGIHHSTADGSTASLKQWMGTVDGESNWHV